MSDYRVLDLFSGLGGFSSAFEDSDRWGVTTVDIEPDFAPDICADVFALQPADLPSAEVVLCGHPCTLFSTAGNHDEWDLDRKEPVGERARKHVAMLFHALGLIQAVSPTYWYLENPRRSRIRWFIGPPDNWVSYCQYGKDYQKDTGFWGTHAPMVFEKCPGRGATCHVSNTETDGTSAIASMDTSDHGERSKVPYELSEAIRNACEAALDGTVPEQSTLAEAVET